MLKFTHQHLHVAQLNVSLYNLQVLSFSTHQHHSNLARLGAMKNVCVKLRDRGKTKTFLFISFIPQSIIYLMLHVFSLNDDADNITMCVYSVTLGYYSQTFETFSKVTYAHRVTKVPTIGC